MKWEVHFVGNGGNRVFGIFERFEEQTEGRRRDTRFMRRYLGLK